MKPRDYCCCAIPLVNAGIYTTLTEQFVLAIVAGTLSIATPSIVGASTPSVAKVVFAILCYVAAAVQVLGLVGVMKERPITYKRYAALNMFITIAIFSVAAVWIILSATGHNKAKANCQSEFFTSDDTTSLSDTLCNIFPWVDVGVMGGIWLLLGIVQTYLCFITSSYGKGQRLDHEKYDSMYDPTRPLTSDIAVSHRSEPWETSNQNLSRGLDNVHSRGDSVTSMDTVMADKPSQFSDNPYGANTYPPSVPGQAYTQSPGPTPHATEYYSSGYGAGMGAPDPTQAHPGRS